MLEIEKKARVSNMEELRQLLDQNPNYTYNGKFHKGDLYFSDKVLSTYKDFRNLETLFRVRKQGKDWYLTLKRKGFSGNTEINQEYEVPVKRGEEDSLKNFLIGVLGLPTTQWDEKEILSIQSSKDWISFWEDRGFFFVLDKEKETFLYCTQIEGFDVSVELNDIKGLGSFLEIEVLTQNPEDVESIVALIDKIFQDFSIMPSQEEPRLYIELLYEQRLSHGKNS